MASPKVGVADDVVPVVDRDLAGEQRAAGGLAVVEDLEEVVSSLAREGSEPPAVEDEEPGPCEARYELGVRPVAPGEGEFVEQAGDPVAASRDAEAAGLVAEGTGEITLPRPRDAADEDGLAVPDPLPGSEAQDEGSVEAVGGGLKLRSSMVALRWSLARPLDARSGVVAVRSTHVRGPGRGWS